MSKRMTRVLSLILTLVMFVSVSTPAFAWGGGDLGSGWDREIGEDEIRDFDEPVVEEEETQDYFHALDEDSLLEVTVEAPMGALPTLAELRAEPVEIEDVREAVESVVDGKANILVAMDISFWMNGVEIEPEEPVNVKISAPELADKSNLTLVHIPDAAEPETIDLIDDEDLGFALGTTEIAFKANSFSVYAIVEGGEGTADDQPYRTTYEFYNADGTEYYFKDAAGRDQYTQILKDGEILEDVGIPTKGASQNAKFVGWYDEDGNKVEVGVAKEVKANKTIKLTAKLQGIVNVMFVTAVMKDDQGQDMERSVVTVKQVEFTIHQTGAITVDTSDVTTEAPTSEQAVVGWNSNETAANAGTVEGTDGVITLYPNGEGEIVDVMLFPAIQNAYWLYFNENDGGTGGGASYTPPQFVTIGGKPTKPADPHRTGYEFGGWYKDAACTQPFDFNAVMNATTTVYAKWEGSDTTYTVIVLVQKTADSANVTSAQNLPHASKTYDFYAAYTENAKTGDTVSVANSYTRLANTIDKSGHIKYETCDDEKEVAADGSTVLYVYYQRDVMTIVFRTRNSVLYTWYGLYDATFEESGKTWDSNYSWSSSNYTYSFLDSFKSFDRESDTSLTLYRGTESGRATITFLKEKLDGTWEEANSFRMDNNSYFTLSSKYTGFTLSQYSTDGSNWNTASEDQEVYYGNYLYIRNTRNTYNIEYHNGVLGAEGTVVRTDKVKYEAPLANHENPTVTYPVAADADHYEFIGWFADSGCKTMVTFTELDDQTKQNYKNWYGVAEFVVIDEMPAHNFPLYAGYSLKGWDCALNPNGGEFTDQNQAGVFWLAYGGKFASTLKDTIKREGYVFQGWMVAEVPFKADGENLDLLNITTDANNHRFVGDYSNWTMTDTPWQFDTGITGATALMAKWFYKTSMSVVYDAGAGSNAPKDEGKYSDHATTVAFRAPTAPEGQNFIGWDIVGTEAEEKLQPGATFEVSSDYAVNGVVTLKAVYHAFNSEEEVPVSHIDWYANNTDKVEGELKHVTDDKLQLNAGVDIRPATTFTNYGYKFLGWAKLHNDNGTLKDHKNVTVAAADGDHMDYALTAENLYLKYEDNKFKVETSDGWVETTQVAADENQPYDDMYAVWEKQYFYVYHSSNCEVVRYEVAEGENGFNLTQLVYDGNMYGGYYKKYNRAGADFDATTAEYSDNKTTDAAGKAYKGGSGAWTKSRAYTVNGRTMIPEAGKTYFLKEVPNDVFLQNYTHVIFDTRDDNTLKKIFMISSLDDTNYSTIDLYAENSFGARTKLAVSYVFGESANTKETVINAQTFNAEAGFVAVWNPADLSAVENGCKYVIPTYTTPDGVIVDGSKMRVVTFGDGKIDASGKIVDITSGKFSVSDSDNTMTLDTTLKGNIAKPRTQN